ncbi:hypothetical protein FPCIR_11448 [Fusarium pseudocircinatum]|uniref:Apple domain-containing protein n=1 Tax=Fusarium pseudocircinatum TaxID=56676 RepID=A0A8H5NTM6_9HYPO|nr:hypothetical protein FPCIR_11448 [Fusarium pseudocircinatum]
MKTTIAMLTASMATAILAHPFDARSQQCNIAPSASPSTKIQPLTTPSASTAQACQKLCTEHASCKSFLFGLAADAKAPTCKLYSVPAAQVPNQGNNLYVFDKACSSKAVPNTKPTQDKPRGEVKVRSERDDKPHGKPPVKDQDHAGDKPPKDKAPVNPPNNKRDKKPDGKPPVDGQPPAGDRPKGKAPQNPPHSKRDNKPKGKPPVDGQPPAGDKPKNKKAPVNPPNKRDDKPEGKPEDKPRVGDKPPKNKGPKNPPHNNKRGIKPEGKPHGDDKPKAPLPPKDKNSGKHN